MGKAVACQLAEKGANVVIVARTVKKLEDALVGLKVGSSSAHCPWLMVLIDYGRLLPFILKSRSSTISALTSPKSPSASGS